MLLARKFAADFSERYRMPAVKFDDDAKRLISSYRWPGNVRQLKNVVEQLALFHAGGEIGAHELEPYLPQNAVIYSPVPTSAGAGAHSYDHERELLFNMLFRMQREIDELQNRLDAFEKPAVKAAPTADYEVMEMPKSLVHYNPDACNLMKTPPTTVEIPLSAPTPTLEQTERETIRRSLEKNGGRRKATASELNISERTLYRKIKEYGLE